MRISVRNKHSLSKGCRQKVRQGILIPSFASSILASSVGGRAIRNSNYKQVQINIYGIQSKNKYQRPPYN